MDKATAQSDGNGTLQPAETKPRWLESLETELCADEDLGSYISRAILDILRPMLQSPPEDTEASMRAATKIAEYYVGPYLDSLHPPVFKPNEDTLTPFFNEVARLCFELAVQLSFPCLELDRLAQVLIELFKLGPPAFGVEENDPDFNSFHKGVGVEVFDHWEHDSVPTLELGNYKDDCRAGVCAAVMFAKFYQDGALPEDGGKFAVVEITTGLGFRKSTAGGKYSAYTLSFAQEVATQYILISAEALAKEVRYPTEGKDRVVSENDWKAWANGFRKLADESYGELKEHAEQAFAKMVRLLPELFEEGKLDAG